jgi:hypothetical protein
MAPRQWAVRRGTVGAEYPVALCDLGIFLNQAAEPVSPQDADILAHSGRTLTSSGQSLAERPVRAMTVTVLHVLTHDQPQPDAELPFPDLRENNRSTAV